MTRTIATLIALTAIAGCSSDNPSVAESSTATVVQSTSLPLSRAQASELELAQLAPEAFAPEAFAPEAYEAPAPYADPRVEAVRASTCDIIVRRTPNGVMLKAVANLSRPTAGDYSFVITKNGGGGSSDINQGGELESYAGRHELGSSEISLGRGASYRATLKLISPGGREICRRVVRS